MNTLIVLIYILGYSAIALEQPIKINKSASAILTGVLCWVIYILWNDNKDIVSRELLAHLGQISSILFFVLSAMTIVQIIDAHDGFDVITRRIVTRDKRKLLWICGLVAFFLSAVLDNLTTAIVMVTLLRKLIRDRRLRMYFIGIVVIAANAGGVWTPIGDITTTMLWIGGQITSANIMLELFIPSLTCLVVPLLLLSFTIKGKIKEEFVSETDGTTYKNRFEQRLIFLLGVTTLILVPVFKTMTGLPPFMGILFGLGILWLATEIIHKGKNEEEKNVYSAVHAIRKTDVPSILFFLGILLAIGALESTHLLSAFAGYMDEKIGNLNLIGLSIGLISAVVDNVPLVAAVMGMYDLQTYPTDHYFWEFIAYCAGTGGSCLIIGSAAGVAAMGMEKIDFIWYLKKFSWMALLGFLAGALVYMISN